MSSDEPPARLTASMRSGQWAMSLIKKIPHPCTRRRVPVKLAGQNSCPLSPLPARATRQKNLGRKQGVERSTASGTCDQTKERASFYKTGREQSAGFSTGSLQFFLKRTRWGPPALASSATSDVPSASETFSETVLFQLLLIDPACAGAVLALWYFVFSAYNRRKGAVALRWVQSACAGHGRIVEWRWLGSARLHARFRFPSRWFENARVTMKFRPRALPVP